MPVVAGGAAGSLSKPVISGICSDELYRAITTFEDKYFPGERKGYVDPAGFKHMEDLAAASLRARIDFVAPVAFLGQPTGPTKVISGTTFGGVTQNDVLFFGIVGDSNNVVKTVSADVPNAVTIEDAGVVGSGIHWFRLSRARVDKATIQAKDAKGTVVTSFLLDVVLVPVVSSGSMDFSIDPADPNHPNTTTLRLTTPKDDADYIDTRMTGIGYNIYLRGFKVYCTGMNIPIDVPNSLVDLNPTKFEPIDAKVYDTLAQANEAIRRAPAKAKGVMPFAYYRGAGGAVIAPTIFSSAITPRIMATYREAVRQYAESVVHDLTGLAISIVGGRILHMILPRFFRLGSGEPEPPRAALRPPIPEPPAMTRLRNTASDALKKNPLRTGEVLSSPRVYRHSLTAQNPPASYALIEKEGSMKLSDIRGNAHYGEGVYAWPAGSQGAGKYIDIEVPPGTGVETLKVGNETWVRMVPPNGNRLPVKIVGSNLSPAQIEWGKKLAKPLSGD
jgi:hypothetical protein